MVSIKLVSIDVGFDVDNDVEVDVSISVDVFFCDWYWKIRERLIVNI